MTGISNIIVHILLFISLYFEIFLLVIFFEHFPKIEKNESEEKKKRYYPSATIIVPCYNEERTITRTVLSLLKLDYPKNKLNIFIVNDGSTDNTARIIDKFTKHKNIQVLHKENGGKHTALNFALEYVTSELVGCLDADSFVDTQALKEIAKYFDNKKVMAVTPAMKVYNPKGLIQRIQKAEYNLGILVRRIFSFIDALLVTPGPFSIFRMEVFNTLGVYKQAHNAEDFEIALRMQKNHYKIENAHTAIVYTTAPKTFKALYRQRIRWTYGFIKNIFDYRSLLFKKQYGNFGLFVLPASAFLIFSTLYFTGLFIFGILSSIGNKFIEIQSIGFNMFGSNMSLFFVNTQSALFIVYTLFILTFLLIILGKYISQEKKLLSSDILYYLLLYGFIAPFWLVTATVNVVRSHKDSWIDEKGV